MVEICEYLKTTTGIWMLKFIWAIPIWKFLQNILKDSGPISLAFENLATCELLCSSVSCSLFLLPSAQFTVVFILISWGIVISGARTKTAIATWTWCTKVHETYTARRLQHSKTLCWRYWSEHFLHCVHSTHLFIYHPGSQSAANYTS